MELMEVIECMEVKEIMLVKGDITLTMSMKVLEVIVYKVFKCNPVRESH